MVGFLVLGREMFGVGLEVFSGYNLGFFIRVLEKKLCKLVV